jgi:hypothetical protein
MKNFRTITIKDPRIRQVRNNLRMIIALACWDEIEFLMALRDSPTNNSLPSDKAIELNSNILDLQEALRKSICICGTCHSFENDMIYFPSLTAWHCIKCYEKGVIWFPE